MRDFVFFWLGFSVIPGLLALWCVAAVLKTVIVGIRQDRLKRTAALYPLAKSSDSEIRRTAAIQ